MSASVGPGLPRACPAPVSAQPRPPGAMAHRGRLRGAQVPVEPGAPSVCVMPPQLPTPAPCLSARRHPGSAPGGCRGQVCAHALSLPPTAPSSSFSAASVLEWQHEEPNNRFYAESPKGVGLLGYRKTLGRAKAFWALQSDLLRCRRACWGPGTAPAALTKAQGAPSSPCI